MSGLTCVVCDQLLKGRQRKFCSDQCSNRHWNTGDRAKRRQLRHWYGIELEQWEELRSIQGSKCLACGEEEEKPHLDHDHQSGPIRGLLCRPCNLTLGHSKESIKRLEGLAEYLRKFACNQNNCSDIVNTCTRPPRRRHSRVA